MSIFFITDQTAQRPNIEIKLSLVSLLTTKSFLECRLPGIISRLAMEKVPAMAWVGHQREWQIKLPNATSGFSYELKQQTLKPIPGTIKLHSVVGNGDGVVHVRQLSCFCIECYDGNNFEFGCSGWTRHDHFSTDSQVSEATASTSQQLSKAAKKPGQDSPMSPEAPARNEKEEQGISLVIPEVNDYVAAVYSGDGKWYIGMVIEVDEDDEEANISSMVPQDTENQFKWPAGKILYGRPSSTYVAR